MDALIKKTKKKMEVMMDNLLKKDIQRDKKCDMAEKKSKTKKN